MTSEQAIKIIEDDRDHIKHHLTEKGKAEDFYRELGDTVIAYDMAITALENIGHLTDRPCDVCEFHKEHGCCKWTCIFCDGLFTGIRGKE